MNKFFLLIVLTGLGLGSIAVATETPKYRVLVAEGEFETRQYSSLIIAQTMVDSDFDTASSQGFRKLAGYIFGKNTKAEKIAMTAPVGQELRDGKYVISFTMPSSYTLDTLPTPEDKSVILKAIPEKTYASIRFSGTWTKAEYQDHLTSLEAWIKKKNYQALAEAHYARYNPPWTLWFMRRNEILIEVKI